MSKATDALTVRMQDQIDHIRERIAQINGNLNSNYTGHKFEDTLIAVDADGERSYWEARLQELEYLLMSHNQLFHPEVDISQGIAAGDVVTLEKAQDHMQMRFRLAERLELYPGEKCMSSSSPLGQQVIGKKPGDMLEVRTLSGKQKYKVQSFERE